MGKTQPERAVEAKNTALRVFNNNPLIAAISIAPRDVCDVSMAGFGSRGDRAICRDRMSSGSNGPALVVIPAKANMPAFAIGKYEVSIREFNQYCSAVQSCTPVSENDDIMPVTRISISMANSYLRWLSETTQQRYRLPTHDEWKHAANSSKNSHDPNRNCQLSSRGITKGGSLVRTTTGLQNNWGLVNYLGNAGEWVYDRGRNLLSVGGSFEDPMERCEVAMSVTHSGDPDPVTGFRVLREIAR
jgi:formylglycine-generating enzyme required for sulfatase activity